MRATKHPVGYRKVTIAIAVLCCMAVLTAINTNAQVNTDPVGFINLKVTGPANAQYSLLGLGMTQIVTNRGLISSVSGTSITVSNTLPDGQFVGTVNGPAFFIEITSGGGMGVQDDIVTNTPTTIVTKDDLSALGLVGQSYKVYPHWTIGAVFGPQDQSGLLGGNSYQAADNILVLNPVTAGTTYYYFRTNVTGATPCPGGGCGWRTSGSPSSNVVNTVLYLEQGLMVSRLNNPGTNILLAGAVKLGSTLSVVDPSGTAGRYTLAGNVYPTTNSTLGASGLFTGNASTGLLGGNSYQAADQILFPNGSGGYTYYYFRTNVTGATPCPGGGCGWRNSGNPSANQASVGFPMGGGFFILRVNAGSFSWSVPQPFTQ